MNETRKKVQKRLFSQLTALVILQDNFIFVHSLNSEISSVFSSQNSSVKVLVVAYQCWLVEVSCGL
jgi:hypothetical protein